ncbi:MAG: hypothetical protein OK457_09480 [Thaumarchaeota archaeon]|nr:hypothetical protein [Nitrososphaerota archaeon]
MSIQAKSAEPSSRASPGGVQSKRPGAVTALGGIEIILGIFSFFGGFVHVFLGIGSIVNFNGQGMTGPAANDLGALLILVGILFLVSGGITFSRPKGSWQFGLAVAIIGLISGIVSLALQTVGAIPGLVLSLLILYLLSRPGVRNFLKK